MARSSFDRTVQVMQDGNCMCALLGRNLEEGESEFEEIAAPGCAAEQQAAGEIALHRLLTRLRLKEVAVVWHPLRGNYD